MHRITHFAMVAALLMSAASTTGSAQTRVTGTVYDSLLTRAPLAGARVELQGLDMSVETDRRGRFTLDNVPFGRYQATFFHPSLDSLALSAPIYSFEVSDRGANRLLMATPSFATTARAICGTTLDTATTILLARVRDAESGTPLPDALAEISWWEMTLVPGAGLQREDKRLLARADSSGAVTLCGVPSDIELSVLARKGQQTTGEIILPRGMQTIAQQELRISLTDTAAMARPANAETDTLPRLRGGSARLRLVVRDARGRPVKDAAVSVRGQGVGGVTNDSGQVLLRGIPAGSQTVDVRAIARAPERRTVAFAPGRETTVTVALGEVAQQLQQVVVRGIQRGVEEQAYDRRKRAGGGQFLEADDLDRIGRRATGLLGSVPSLRIPLTTTNPLGGGGAYQSQFPMVYMRTNDGSLCTPNMFVDGVPWQRFDGFDLHSMLQIATRMEVYARGMTVPPEFAAGGFQCGVIAIWTT